MPTKSLFSATFFFIVILNFSFAQEPYCPSRVGYSSTACAPHQPAGFYMFSAPYGSGYQTVVFDFNNPDCDGSHDFSYILCYGNKMMDIDPPICMAEYPTGTVTFQDWNLTCHYTNGELDGEFQTDCLNLINDCKAPLIEFAQDFISSSPNCKLWEGPCATESGIWRTGDVNIGSVVSNSNFKLGVRGGIVTEMLQICKPEWCDYVFEDSFNLMPLHELRDFIRANGCLPDCIPAKKVAQEGGFSLDEETIHQQKKIEEIFLHLITARKRLDRIEHKVVPLTQTPNLPPKPIEYKGGEYTLSKVDVLAQIECFQIKSAPNGTAGVTISNANGPFDLEWNGPANGSMNKISCLNGAIQIHNLAAGQYTVIVSNASGSLGACNFTISPGSISPICNVFSDPYCRQAILEMLENEAFGTPPDCKQWEGDPCSHEDPIYRLGNVGIGTSVGRAGYSLAVKGGIVADKLRVELCESQGWCDYVFDEGYPLLSLPEVESFIKVHRHLPGTISQKEVAKDGGFELREVKLDQQKKIEEAYLHLIALNKKKEALKLKVNNLYNN